MKSSRPDTKVVFIVGSTATGKSDLAVLASEKIGETHSFMPEIINCDSVQFFDGVEIGAAKPHADLLSRVPHHLIGHVPMGCEYTAGDFRRDALSVIENSNSARFYFAVGGSGFYIQALEKGMYDVPKASQEVRAQIEAEAERDLASLYSELKSLDPVATLKIRPQDKYRIVRALEILRVSPAGSTLSEIRERFEKSRPPAPFQYSKIGLYFERDVLRKRVTERVLGMLKNGLIEEVEKLRKMGLEKWSPMLSVGYKETQSFLEGRLAKNDLQDAIVTATMQLAKRQMTWFKRDLEIKWFDMSLGFEPAIAHALVSSSQAST